MRLTDHLLYSYNISTLGRKHARMKLLLWIENYEVKASTHSTTLIWITKTKVVTLHKILWSLDKIYCFACPYLGESMELVSLWRNSVTLRQLPAKKPFLFESPTQRKVRYFNCWDRKCQTTPFGVNIFLRTTNFNKHQEGRRRNPSLVSAVFLLSL